MGLNLLLKSKTFWAGALAAVGVLLSADAITAPVILQAVSMLLGAIGVRAAISKNGTGV